MAATQEVVSLPHARRSCEALTELGGSWARGAHPPRPASTRFTYSASGEMSPSAGEPRVGGGCGSARMLGVRAGGL